MKNHENAHDGPEPFWKFDVIGFQDGLSVIQTQDVDTSTTRPYDQHYAQDETLSL
ncbi:hypothetical protein [Komagataeibacter diospyri]|uniref:hypothetical protein n=1 Tax=Komagataeibacter diospyri TaxID=1932662 RepID=UPI0011342B1B|nr:hypothetical protein MSKU15_0479 [Komagataeibacter diospyri]